MRVASGAFALAAILSMSLKEIPVQYCPACAHPITETEPAKRYACAEHDALNTRHKPECANGFVKSGEYRRPKIGDWYLSAYGAVCAKRDDLDYSFWILKPYREHTT